MTDEEVRAEEDISGEIFSNENILLAGIIISGMGALWASLAHERVLLLGVFFLVAMALVFIRFPKAWSHLFWIAGIYVMLMFGPLIVFGLLHASIWYLFIGGGLAVIGFALADVFVEHVKKARDEYSDVEYVSLGFWSLSVTMFMAASIISAYGLFAWTRGSSPWLYIISEAYIVLAIPFILLKVEQVGATIMVNPEDILHFGEERCPSCDANLTLETKNCPACNAPRLFKWCAICESYSTVCGECKEQILWLDTCQYCNHTLNDKIRCRACSESFMPSNWISKEDA